MELTSDILPTLSLEELTEKFMILKDTDPFVAWRLLEKMGYDLWLQEVRFVDYIDKTDLFNTQPNIELLEQLLKFVEVDICKER